MLEAILMELFNKLINYLSIEKKTFSQLISPDLSYPGKYIWSKKLTIGKKNKNSYKGKVVILVNENTISHAEWTVMCLQTIDKAIVVGSQTAGADGNVTIFNFLDDHKTGFSGLGVFYPDGRETQRIGIVPDIEVKKTINGLIKGKDEVLEKALELIQ